MRSILLALRSPHSQVGNVLLALRLEILLPVESLHALVRLRHLRQRISIVLGRIEIVYGLQLAILEPGGKHLAVHLVHGRVLLLLLQEKQRIRTPQRIETPQGRSGIEVSHHLRRPDLIEENRGFLGNYERVRHQARPVDTRRIHQHPDTVGRILAVAVVPDYGIDVETGDAVEFVETHGIAGHLDIFPEDLDVPDSQGESDARSVGRREIGQRIGDRDRIGAGLCKRIGESHLRQRRRIQLHPQRIGIREIARQSACGSGVFRRGGGIARQSVFSGGGRLSPACSTSCGTHTTRDRRLTPGQQRITVRILLRGLPRSLLRSNQRLAPILRHRIAVNLGQTLLRRLGNLFRNIALAESIVNQLVRPDVDGVYLRALHGIRPHHLVFGAERDGRLLPQSHLLEGILVEKFVCQRECVAGSVLNLYFVQHQDVVRHAVVVERVAPGLLLLRGGVHETVEEEGFLQALVPAAVGRQHVIVFPEIYLLGEHRPARARLIVDAVALDEDGVGIHVHVALELEETLLGIV